MCIVVGSSEGGGDFGGVFGPGTLAFPWGLPTGLPTIGVVAASDVLPLAMPNSCGCWRLGGGDLELRPIRLLTGAATADTTMSLKALDFGQL